MSDVQPILIFGYGNPGRGDDALGALLIEAIEKLHLPDVECLNDMQLQVENVTDMEQRSFIVFVDADVSCESPFEYSGLAPEKDGSYTSHAMSPAALLHAFRQVYGREVPPAFLLRIRGYDFELGDPLSELAAANLSAAVEFVASLIRSHGKGR